MAIPAKQRGYYICARSQNDPSGFWICYARSAVWVLQDVTDCDSMKCSSIPIVYNSNRLMPPAERHLCIPLLGLVYNLYIYILTLKDLFPAPA